MLLRSRAAAIVLAACSSSCVNDVVLPGSDAEPVCGNGILEPGEACDVASPGCVACSVLPNWTCEGASCSQACGDGVVGEGAGCAAPRRERACDMSGYWATRETNYTRDAVIGSIQTSSNWFLFRFEQTGEDFHVVESLDCGVHVTGTVTVDSTSDTLRSSLYANRMDGVGARRARRGRSRASDGGCEISLERWYKVRGVIDDFLPVDFEVAPPLASLPPLPKVDDPVRGTGTPPGATDPDGDGVPGTSYRITGFVSGIRNSAQRDWKEYATRPGAPAPAAALSFAIPGAFDLEESVLRVTDCGSTCGLMAAGARAESAIPGRLSLSFIGRALDGPRVAAVVEGPPRSSLDVDLATCANVRSLLPHEDER